MSARAPEEVDVVIVGAGAAGSVHAAVLAAAGRSVVVLEGGPARRLGDLYSSQMWARRLKWTAPSAVNGGADPAGISFNAGHGYGGAAIHHYAVWPRFHTADFRMASEHGGGSNGRSITKRCAHSTIVSRPRSACPATRRRSAGDRPGAPYPLPPLPAFPQGETIAARVRGARAAHRPAAERDPHPGV